MNINNLSGHEFEEVIERLVRKMGFTVEERKLTADGGIDIKAKNEEPILKGIYIIQCKRYDKPVGEAIIRDLFGVVSSERANKGILITNSTFTRSAKEFASNKPIELIDTHLLKELIKKYFAETNKEHSTLKVSEKYKILHDLIDEYLTDMERKRQEVITGRRTLQTNELQEDVFISYCWNKANEFTGICQLLGEKVNLLNSLLISYPSDLNYIDSLELKSRIKNIFSQLDILETAWEDSLLVVPPDNLRSLHRSLVRLYETYFEAFKDFSEKLSYIINSPEKHLSETSTNITEEQDPTTNLTFLLKPEYSETFTKELKSALSKNSLFTKALNSVQRKNNPFYKVWDSIKTIVNPRKTKVT